MMKKNETPYDFSELNDLDNNLYYEFQNIVSDLSLEITNNVMNSIVSNPLDEVYVRYEKLYSELKEAQIQMAKVATTINNAKSDLFENLSSIVSELSKDMIDTQVLRLLYNVKDEFDKQLPLISSQSNDLIKYIDQFRTLGIEYSKKFDSIFHVTDNKLSFMLEEIDNLFTNKISEFELIKTAMEKYSDTLQKLELTIEQNSNLNFERFVQATNMMITKNNEKTYRDFYGRLDGLTSSHNDLNKIMIQDLKKLNDSSDECNQAIIKLQETTTSIKSILIDMDRERTKTTKIIFRKLQNHTIVQILLGIGVGYIIFLLM